MTGAGLPGFSKEFFAYLEQVQIPYIGRLSPHLIENFFGYWHGAHGTNSDTNMSIIVVTGPTNLRSLYLQNLEWQYTITAMKIELVTTLKRQATKILAELHESKEPVLITEHGQPSAYLIDVDDYELMQNRIRILEGIARGESAVFESRIYDQSDAKEKMSKWLK